MIKNETLHIRVNGNVKAQDERTLDTLGVSVSEVINMLLHQIVLVGGIPFDVKIPSAPERVTFTNEKELIGMLDNGMQQITEGRVVSADLVMEKMRKKYGL